MGKGDIWTFSEIRSLALELVSGGRSLAGNENTVITALVAGDKELAGDCIKYGADEVVLFPGDSSVPVEAYSHSIARLAREKEPQIILIGATKRGKTLAAILAEELDTGCSTEITSLRLEEGGLVAERLFYGGIAVVSETCLSRPQMATVPLHTWEAVKVDENRQGKITEVDADLSSYPIKILERKPKPPGTVNIEEASAVVCLGRGVGSKDDLPMMEELAALIDGVLGCSRPLAEDLHWLPSDRFIGLSGKQTKADLLMCIGISGQVQFTTGIRDVKVVFSVDKNEKAPIFQASDYGIVGDLYQVVPLLVKELKSSKT